LLAPTIQYPPIHKSNKIIKSTSAAPSKYPATEENTTLTDKTEEITADTKEESGITKKSLNINIILQNSNKSLFVNFKNKLESERFKKIVLKLRNYSNALFFKECLNILSIVIKKRNSAKLISEFLAFQFSVMKKHNYFLNFLKRALLLIIKSRFSFIKGFKLIINGRLNGKPRAKNKFLIVGKVPLQSINSKVDYSTSVSYSQYGTFGFKVWICE
jgi:hypothetical protein